MGVVGTGLENVCLSVEGTISGDKGHTGVSMLDSEPSSLEFEPENWWLEDDQGEIIVCHPEVVKFFRERCGKEAIEDAIYYA